MRIVFQKVAQWEDAQHAEAELALRMLAAARSVESVDAIATSNMDEIASFDPDIVFPLHVLVPKLFDAFTVGCMWDPVSRIKRNSTWDNIKSYDGYGIASDTQEQFVRALKFKSPHPYLLSRIYPSTNITAFKKPKTFNTAVYIGSGWSKDRHRSLFSSAKNISVYGPNDSWDYLANSIYCGEIPFDGKSSLKIYHEAGIGLSLHHKKHNLEGIPSMRPFEIAASSSVIISDQNAFVQESFGDSALYLDTSLGDAEVNEQLNQLTDWVQNHKTQAQEMAEASHKTFVEKYSLEVLLENLIRDVDQFKKAYNFPTAKNLPEVEIIVRTDGKDKAKLYRALKSIDTQSYQMATALLIYRGTEDHLHSLQQGIQEKLPDLKIKYISANEESDRGSQFYTGLRASTASYIGFLDHDDTLFSDHVSVLLDSLSKYPDAPLAYSGSIRVWEDGNPPEGEEIRKLAYFYELEKNSEFKSCITSNSFIVRRERIPWSILNQPIPKMDVRDDYIFLDLIYRINSNFLFSGKVTCSFYWRTTKKDNSAFETKPQITKKKVYGKILRLSKTRIAYGESAETNSPEPSHLFISGFVRKIITILRNDVSVIIARLKGNDI